MTKINTISAAIYGVNLPPAMTKLRAVLASVMASGSQAGGANAAMYMVLTSDLAPLAKYIVDREASFFDKAGRANPISAYEALYPLLTTIQAALEEVRDAGVSPIFTDILQEHLDERDPLHFVAAYCFLMILGAQIYQ